MKDCNFSRAFADAFYEHAVAEAYRLVDPYVAAAESQIEANFAAAFCFVARQCGYLTITAKEEHTGSPKTIDIHQQVIIEKFRVDFLIGLNEREVIVECDGRDFHHSTRSQIDRDRARDARLAELGYRVIRFPGRQLDSAPFECAVDVISWLVLGKFPERK